VKRGFLRESFPLFPESSANIKHRKYKAKLISPECSVSRRIQREMKSGVRKKVKPEKHSDSKVREPFHIKD
jgi:hypothetical protein